MRFAIAYLFLLAPGFSTAFGQEYDVLFHRITKAGDKAETTIRFSEEDTRQIILDGQAQPEDKVTLKISFSGRAEEVSVTPDGNSNEAKVVISHCTCSLNGENVPLLTAGDVLTVKRVAQEFMINGKSVEGMQLSLLKEMFPPVAGYAADSEDQLYGPKRKVKVGDTWPVNPDFVISEMSKKGVTLARDAVTGAVKLDNAHPVNDTPCLQVSSEMTMTAKGVPMPDAPPTMKCTKFQVITKESNDLPVDHHLDRLSQRLEVRVETESSGTTDVNGRSAATAMHSTNLRKIEAILVPLP